MEPLALTSFGATIAEMDLDQTKLAGVMDWIREHPQLVGGALGALPGYAVGVATTPEEKREQRQIRGLLGALLGAAGGAYLGSKFAPSSSSSASSPAAGRSSSSPASASPPPEPAAEKLVNSPVQPPEQTPVVQEATRITAPEAERRLAATEAAMRSEVSRRAQQAALREAVQKEQMNLLRDYARVQTRASALLRPTTATVGGKTITITPGPGVQQFYPSPTGAPTPEVLQAVRLNPRLASLVPPSVKTGSARQTALRVLEGMRKEGKIC